MFSIIIPLYNKEKYIKNTIESVLKQTYTDFELIIIDDSSNDKSYSIVSKIKDKRIKLVKKANGGVSDTRNYGIRLAEKDYIIFLDADDLWALNFLESLYNLIKRYPNAEMYGMSYKIKDKIIKLDSNQKYIWIPDYFQYAHKNICSASSTCFKKELIKKVGFFRKGVKRGEDLDFWVRSALIAHGIAFYNEPVATYNLVEENSAALSYNNYKESFPYWEWYEKSSKSPYFKKYVSYMIYALAKNAFKNKKYSDVIEIIDKCRGKYKIIKRTYMKLVSYLKK